MRVLYSLLLTVCILIGPHLPALAQQPYPLTPEESVRWGLAQSHQLRATEAEADAAHAVYRQARAARFPAFSSQASYTRLSDNIPAITADLPSFPGLDSTSFTLAPVELNQFYTQFSVDQPLFTGFRLRNRIAAAKHQAEAAAYEAAQSEVDVAYQIRQAYWNLYRARAFRDVMDDALAQVEAHLQDVRNRREVGAALERDVLTAQTRRAEVQLDRVEAANAVRVARLNLNRLIGLPLDTETQPAATVEVEPLPADVEALVDRALEVQPQLQALDAQTRALEANVGAAQSRWFPDIALFGRYVYARPNQYFFLEQDEFKGSWEAGASLKWTLWNWGQRPAEISEARARLRSAEAQRAFAREGVAVEVTRQYLEMQRAMEAVAVAEQSVQEAEEVFRLLRSQYVEGAALSADVLDAEVAFRRAELRRAEAQADYAVARAGLLHALGQVE